MADQEGIRPIACGYGLLGLCCDSCLHGPCRRSPFDAAGSGKRCWEDSDWIVANHLMERVALESLQAMAAFTDAAERASDQKRQSETAKLDAMKALLSPFSLKRDVLLDILYPEEAFPFFHSGDVPAGSWMTMLLGAMSRPPARRDPEAILADALRLAAMALAAEALAQELTGSTTRKSRPVGGEKGRNNKPAASLPGRPALWAGSFACSTPEEIDAALPDAPSPILLLISDEDGLRDGGREAQETLMNNIDRTCRKTARIYRLPHAALLPAFARRVYEKWGLPVTMTGSIAVVFSSSMIPGLGALALGFSLVPLPGYPIQGSPRVEKYLTQDLKSKFGHAYLAVPPREDLCDAIMRSLPS